MAFYWAELPMVLNVIYNDWSVIGLWFNFLYFVVLIAFISAFVLFLFLNQLLVIAVL